MSSPFTFDPAQSEETQGRHATDRTLYRPLETVTLSVARAGARAARLWAYDAAHNLYAVRSIPLRAGAGSVRFAAAGHPGTHTLRIRYDDGLLRPCFFRVEARTQIETGDPAFDEFQGHLEAVTAKCCAEAPVGGQPVSLAGRAGDTSLKLWFRDGGYGLLGYALWHPFLREFCDFFLQSQDRDGFFRDNWLAVFDDAPAPFQRCHNEPDVEAVAVLAVHRAWQATGDDAWLARCLPRLERGLRAIRDPRLRTMPVIQHGGRSFPSYYRNAWHAPWGLVKRTHTCDTWDFQQDRPDGSPVYVAATCDQANYYAAMRCLARLHAHLGRRADAARWRREAAALRRRAQRRLWDGAKFLHHRHIDPFDHGAFDEGAQLAMGNTWAINRGLADPPQAASILREYRKRWRRTGDAWPWWSLQPGYPDGTFPGRRSGPWAKLQGSYANGGLIPWVGGELALAAFNHGDEAFGVRQLRLCHTLLQDSGGGLATWYWPDGRPGVSNAASTSHSIWDVGAWMLALQEGLAGIRDLDRRWETVACTPRWAAAGIACARAVSAYPDGQAWFGYRYTYDAAHRTLHLAFSGTGRRARFAVLLPRGFRVRQVLADGEPLRWTRRRVGHSAYLDFSLPIRRTLQRRAFTDFRPDAETRDAADLNQVDIR